MPRMNIYLSHIGIEGKHCLLAGNKLITHTTTILCAQIKRNVRQTKKRNVLIAWKQFKMHTELK